MGVQAVADAGLGEQVPGPGGVRRELLADSRFLNERNTALADGYAELSGGVGWRAGRVELRIDGHNLTDERPPISESELGDAQ